MQSLPVSPRAPAAAALLLGSLVFAAPVRAQDYTYGIEINGQLCGYAEAHVSTIEDGGKLYTLVTEKVFLMLSLLGSEFSTEIDMTFHVDPATDRFTYHHSRIKQGDTPFELKAFVDGNEVRFVYPLEDDEKTIELPEGVVLENPVRAPHLVRDFVEREAASMSYMVLDIREAETHEITYTLIDRETLELAGARYETVILDRMDEVTGVKMRQWIRVDDGMAVKLEIPGDRLVYLSDPSVKKRIELVNLDSSIVAKVDVAIADIKAISYMKVRAVFEPTGLRATPADLNVPGQKFEGSVVGTRVEGVFTVEHPRYDGESAPTFPSDFTGDPALAEFLAPGELIESDDDKLIEHARKVTAGAKNSWDAARRISKWVAENIDYAIPGGVSARNTFDVRAGECGAHSLLATSLCRGVGIPARVVWGCMYTPSFGGSFGQHAWHEVYMGKAGWIPLDSTAFENDFLDSGHIRVGTYQSFATAINMKEMEVLEHRLLATDNEDVPAAGTLEPYVGEYAHPAGKDPFVVLLKDGALAVDIPGQLVLGLRSPDESGRFYAKLTDRLYCTFPRDDRGEVAALTIHEIVRMQRRGDPDEVPEDVPEELRPYLGTYRLAAIRADFTVVFDEKGFGVHDPNENMVVHLKPTGEPGRWIDEFDKNSVSFVRDDDGEVTALLLDAANKFPRLQDTDPGEPPAVTEVKAMLTGLHRAAAAADAERFFGLFEPTAIVLGTAAGERWTVDRLKSFTAPLFESGQGWISTPTEQNVYLSKDGRLAWFDERVTRPPYGELRGSGVARKTDDRFRVAYYSSAFPVPNELFTDLVKRIAEQPGEAAAALPAAEIPPGHAEAVAAVKALLDGFHRAAAAADRDAYFANLLPDAICFGTDSTERFTVKELDGFTAPYFAAGTGWTHVPARQNVYVAADKSVAWFDECLESPKFGAMRGTGVAIKKNGRWRIAQYNLTLPVPNALAGDLAKRIRELRQ